MSTTTLTTPMRVDTSGVHARPGLGRLVTVEVRKMVDTRAGFWLQIAMVAITAIVVAARSAFGGAADHTFAAVLDLAILPAASLLPVAAVLLVTSEWSQRTGLITFALVPVRTRVLTAKLVASLLAAVAMLVVCVGVVAAGVAIAAPGDGAWADALPLVGQSVVYLTAGMVTGLAFGAMLLASAPALVSLFVLPTAWMAAGSLSFLTGVAPWLDTSRALSPMHREVMSPAQWAHAGTALALWMVLPLLIGIWRIARRGVSV